MERKCSSCGARISDGMKICANCGKVVPQPRTVPSSDSSYAVKQRNNQKVKSMSMPPKGQSANRQAMPQNRQVKIKSKSIGGFKIFKESTGNHAEKEYLC